MKFKRNDLDAYVMAHTSKEPELLQALNRETHVKQLLPQMLCGNQVGMLLRMLSKTIEPNRILEIGTFTGYSALCMAEGLKESGNLVSIDINPELKPIQEKYFELGNIASRIETHVGDAMEIIPKLEGHFELVFIDADKEHYQAYYEMILPLVPSGGYLVVDNVLWNSKVIDPNECDKETLGIRAFNDFVQADPRVENVLLPMEDGIMLIRKI